MKGSMSAKPKPLEFHPKPLQDVLLQSVNLCCVLSLDLGILQKRGPRLDVESVAMAIDSLLKAEMR